MNTIELFAGCGGLALGLEKAGLKHELLVEIDKNAVETLKNNFGESVVLHQDITKVDPKELEVNEPIDVISGGAPCQSFSYAGKRLGIEDARGTLFYDFARFVEHFRPRAFVFENVRGLVNHDNGKTLQTITDIFEQLGYNLKWQILKAVEYGVAQKRERIFIVGIRNDVHEELGEYRFPEPLEEKIVLRDALKDVPESFGATYPDKKRAVMELVPPGGCWVDLPEDVAKEYMGASYYSGGGRRGMARRLSWDEPSLTLTTSPAQKQTERCHPDETRPLTVREYARIQSFPDDFEFSGSMNSQYRQIGNAVPVNLAYHIGLSIKDYLEGNSDESTRRDSEQLGFKLHFS